MGRNRVGDWSDFSEKVVAHIWNYTIPQYGNKEGDENIDSMTFDQCIKAIERYCARAGRNVRGPEEDLRDLLKIAHYAQFAYDKLSFSRRQYEEGQGHD